MEVKIMFGRFTERAQKALLFAKEEAKKTAYPYIEQSTS